ncbi:MAG: hypothetical protein OJF52_002730 [Nitrospira sp.]|nr:MAG: hypothetical protein OJF52_002730 [Nitrospira sp.]
MIIVIPTNQVLAMVGLLLTVEETIRAIKSGSVVEIPLR